MCKIKTIYAIIKSVEIEIMSRIVHSLYNKDRI